MMTHSRKQKLRFRLTTLTLAVSSGCSTEPSSGASKTDELGGEAGAQAVSGESNSERSDAAATAAYELCDGSTKVRFAAAATSFSADYELSRAWSLQYDWYVVVTGTCEVWARTGLQPYRGELSPQKASELTADLRLGRWGDWGSGSGAEENFTVVADADGRTFTCALDGCGMAEGDVAVDVAASLAESIVEANSVLPATGVLSVRRVAGGADAGAAIAAPEALSEVLNEQDLGTKAGYTELTITDATVLAWLREQRDAFFANGFGTSRDILVDVGDGAQYGLAYRDVIPFESSSGDIEALYPE